VRGKNVTAYIKIRIRINMQFLPQNAFGVWAGLHPDPLGELTVFPYPTIGVMNPGTTHIRRDRGREECGKKKGG